MTAILASRSTIEYRLGIGGGFQSLKKRYYFGSYLKEEREYIHSHIHIHSKFVVKTPGNHLNRTLTFKNIWNLCGKIYFLYILHWFIQFKQLNQMGSYKLPLQCNKNCK